MFFPIADWFPAFVLTVAVELAVAGALLRQSEPSILRLGLLIVFANLATHPIVWYVIPQLLLIGTPGYTIVAETWAVAAEAVFYWAAFRGLSIRRALTVSLAANAASWVAGQLVGGLWPDMFR